MSQQPPGPPAGGQPPNQPGDPGDGAGDGQQRRERAPQPAPTAERRTRRGGLLDAFNDAIGKRPPKTLNGAESRFGWDAKRLAAEMGVSVRTAQRWRKAGQVPTRRTEQLGEALAGEAKRRARDRIRTRGIRHIGVTGDYQVESGNREYKQRANGGSFRTLDSIPPEEAREIMDLYDAGDIEGAEERLGQSLSQHYGISSPVKWDNVEHMDIDY